MSDSRTVEGCHWEGNFCPYRLVQNKGGTVMICYNCQKEILEGSRYCYHCGASQKPLTPPPRERKPLRRSRGDKMIAGVCAGFAHYFELDISLVRILWLLVALFGGGGFIAYLICWIIIPYGEEAVPAPIPTPR